jgi:hypothetical protein
MAKKKSPSQKKKPNVISKNGLGEDYYKDRLKKRFWMIIHYTSIPFASAIVFGFAAICETVLFKVLWSLMETEIQQSPIVKNLSEIVQIAISMVTLAGFIVHAGYSLYGQLQVEKEFSTLEE